MQRIYPPCLGFLSCEDLHLLVTLFTHLAPQVPLAVKTPQETQETPIDRWSGGSPGEGSADHSSIPAWTEEPGGLPSMGLRRVRHS